MSRVFLSMTEEEVLALDVAREKMGMTKSQYVRYLMSGKRDIRPPVMRYKELIGSLDLIERDLKVIAMKDSLSDADRLLIMTKLEDLENILSGRLVVERE